MMGCRVMLTDTTLRDGEQGCGFALKAEGKARLAQMLDDAGFHQIEAGIPAMGSCEKDAICRIMDACKRTKVAVWNRMRREDIAHSFDCAPDIVHISAPVSDILMHAMLKTDRAWVKKTLTDCVAYAQDKGYGVTVGFQDASRADTAFMASLAGEMQRLGVLSVRLADTVGILMPMRARRMLESLTAETEMPFGIHTHNDLGMATAVAVEAVKGGAAYVDTTLFGIGERAGNCDSYKFILCGQDLFHLSPAAAEMEKLRMGAMEILFPNGGAEAWNLNNEGDEINENAVDKCTDVDFGIAAAGWPRGLCACTGGRGAVAHGERFG